MKKLPRGFYAVQSDFENSPKNVFKYKGVEYSVEEGVNLFPTVMEACAAAEVVPGESLCGLDYDGFSTPVILMSAGKHNIDRFLLDRSITILGENAGISPNVPGGDDLPSLSPARRENETELVGTYWFGGINLDAPDADTVIMDGFSSEQVRFNDRRTDGGKTFFSFRNIIHKSPCGWHIYTFAETGESSKLDREIEFKNIRMTDFDDLGYGGMFLRLNAHKILLDGLCCNNISGVFGLTDMSMNFPNYSKNFNDCSVGIRNCFFGDFKGENGVSVCFDGAGERSIDFRVENSVFKDTGLPDMPALRADLMGENCRLSVKGCLFRDTRKNSGAAVLAAGDIGRAEFEDCRFEGYEYDYATAPEVPTEAPLFISGANAGFTTECDDPHRVIAADKADFSELDEFYKGRRAYYGDLHVHTACGGTSDGHTPMADWPKHMDEQQVDFAAVVDHKQMRGFFLPEWDDTRFIIGTEPATRIKDARAVRAEMRSVHYNMLFPHKYGLAMVLANFPEFEFQGDELNGSFKYAHFTRERFGELTRFVQSLGGIMVHPHPKTMMSSDDPLDYYFGEHMYLETLYETMSSHASFKNYDLWVELLAMGKHVFASGGSDTHRAVTNAVVSTFYTKERSGRAFFDQMHTGDFTVGNIGMKMFIAGHPMGCELMYHDGMKLTLRLDDFFAPAWCKNTAYELRIYTDKGLCYSSVFDGSKPQRLALEVQRRAFYRAEVFDLTHRYRIAVGNPIWLDA